MRLSVLTAVALVLLGVSCTQAGDGLLVSPGPASAPEPMGGEAASPGTVSLGVNVSTLELLIHDQTNDRRERRGLSPVEWDSALSDVARRHSEDMAARDYFSHVSPEGENAADRCRREGYPIRKIPVGGGGFSLDCSGRYYLGCSENLFRVSRGGGGLGEDEIAVVVVQGWMGSSGHRKNLLKPFWETEGIGVAVAADGSIYVTQNFN